MKLFGPPDADPVDTQARVRFITDRLDSPDSQKIIGYGITPNADYPVYSNTPFTDNVEEWKNPRGQEFFTRNLRTDRSYEDGTPTNQYYIMLPAIPPTPEIPASNGVDAVPAQPGTPALTFPLYTLNRSGPSSPQYPAYVTIKFPGGEVISAFVSAPPVNTNASRGEAPLTDQIRRSTGTAYKVSFLIDPIHGRGNEFIVESLDDKYVLNASRFDLTPRGIIHPEDIDRWEHPENHIEEFFTGHYLIRVPTNNPSTMEQGIALIGINRATSANDINPVVYTSSSIPEFHMRSLRIISDGRPIWDTYRTQVIGNYTRFPDSKDWIKEWRTSARGGGRRKARKARKTKKSKKSRKVRKTRK